MKYCPQCAKEYEDDKSFCSEDASPLRSTEDPTVPTSDLTCTQCGKPLPGGKRFCLYCGAPTGVSAPAPVLCQACGEMVPVEASFCGACGTGLNTHRTASVARTESLSPSVPAQPQIVERQEWQRGVWLGAGSCFAAFLLLGAGIVIGTRISTEDGLIVKSPGITQPPAPGPSGLSGSGSVPPPPPVPPDLAPGRHLIIATEEVPVRRNPSEEAERIGKVSPGKTAVVVKSQGRWVEILSPNGEPGYIPRDTVSPSWQQRERARLVPRRNRTCSATGSILISTEVAGWK